jgi:hypothetical protein
MSRKIAAAFGESLKSRFVPVRLLVPAHSCAQRIQTSLEGLGGASNLLLLSGVGANFVLTYLTGAIIDSGLSLASREGSRQTDSGFGNGLVSGVEVL